MIKLNFKIFFKNSPTLNNSGVCLNHLTVHSLNHKTEKELCRLYHD